MKRLSALIVLTVSLFCGSAFAQVANGPTGGPTTFAQDDVRTVTLLLSGYHDLAPQSSFDAVPNAPAIVETLARGSHSVVRDRALAALGSYWPSADVFLLYANVIASSDTAEGTRHRVVLMMAESFGNTAIPAIKPLLSADDLQLQITAVQALGSIGSDEAFATIVSFSQSVTNPALIEQIDRSARILR